MKLYDVFDNDFEALKDIKDHEGLLGSPNYETIDYWLEKHYKELELSDYLKMRENDILKDIKEAIINGAWMEQF